MLLVLTSSKGISSVVMSRMLGVNQKTAWMLGHAIREMMDDRQGIARPLSGVVEVDEAFVGGKPKFRHGVASKRGRGTGKPIALVAAARNGQARAVLIPNAQGRTMKPIMEGRIDASSVLITDKNSSYTKIGKSFANHMTVQHNKHQYANRKRAYQHRRGRECRRAACSDWRVSSPGTKAPTMLSRRNHLALEPPHARDEGPEVEVFRRPSISRNHDRVETDPGSRPDARPAVRCRWSPDAPHPCVGPSLAMIP